MSFIRKAILACSAGALVLIPTALFAAGEAVAKPAPRMQKATEEKRKALASDAANAIHETQEALKYLSKGKTKEALGALERATGKLELIVARDPALALAPAAVTVVNYETSLDIAAAKKAHKQVKDLVEAGRLQEARWLLRTMASETVTSVSNIPLATYPDAIKNAAKLVDENKMDQAKHVLDVALNTQVLTETVIPRPVVTTQEALKTAEALAEKKNRTQGDNARLKASLDTARSQFEFAHALGYSTTSDLDKMYGQLTAIEDKTKDNKFGVGFFEEIKESIAKLMKPEASKKN